MIIQQCPGIEEGERLWVERTVDDRLDHVMGAIVADGVIVVTDTGVAVTVTVRAIVGRGVAGRSIP